MLIPHVPLSPRQEFLPNCSYEDPTFCCSVTFAFLFPPPLEEDAFVPPDGGFFLPGLFFILTDETITILCTLAIVAD